MVNLNFYLTLALILFMIGFSGIIISKNFIKMLISLEFMILAACINFVAFNCYLNHITQGGQIFALYALSLGAIETAVALCLIIGAYKNKKSIDPVNYEELKD